MTKKSDIKYYDYADIGDMLNCSMNKINNVMFRYDIMSQGNDVEDLITFRVNIISPRFVFDHRDEYNKFFRESTVKGKEGRFKYKLEVTDAFLEFLLTILESSDKFDEERAIEQARIKAENEALKEKAMANQAKQREKERLERLKLEAEFDESNSVGKRVNR